MPRGMAVCLSSVGDVVPIEAAPHPIHIRVNINKHCARKVGMQSMCVAAQGSEGVHASCQISNQQHAHVVHCPSHKLTNSTGGSTSVCVRQQVKRMLTCKLCHVHTHVQTCS